MSSIFQEITIQLKHLWSNPSHSSPTRFSSKFLELVCPKLMVFSFRLPRPLRNPNRELYRVSGYWNGKMAWDRADGNSARSPALSYSNSYKSWRICRADGHLAYDITCDDEMPPTDREWHVYKKGVAPAPKVVIHSADPRLPNPEPKIVFVLGGPGAGKGTMCELAESQLGWKHLSSGELLRAERRTGGRLADTIEECLADGKLVPSEVVVALLKGRHGVHHLQNRNEELSTRRISEVAVEPGKLVRGVRPRRRASENAVLRVPLRRTQGTHSRTCEVHRQKR